RRSCAPWALPRAGWITRCARSMRRGPAISSPGGRSDSRSVRATASKPPSLRDTVIAMENPYVRFRGHTLSLNDYLAIDRTVLANERTLLSYTRTALTMLVI